jgi:putative transposase
MSKIAELDTIWEVPDDLWAGIKKVVDELDPPKGTGRPRVDGRQALNGIIYRLRTSCQWNHLPERFGSDSPVHRTFQRWLENGVFERVWALLVEKCDQLGGVVWKWQSADGSLGKARQGGAMLGRTPRIGARPGVREASWLTATAGR